MPPHPLKNPPGRAGVGDAEGAVGLDGVAGLAGADGLRGAEYERDPLLPPELPLPARASAIAVNSSTATNIPSTPVTIAPRLIVGPPAPSERGPPAATRHIIPPRPRRPAPLCATARTARYHDATRDQRRGDSRGGRSVESWGYLLRYVCPLLHGMQ